MKLALALLLLFPFASQGATILATHSLTQAIASARSGDTIFVQGPTVFHERIVIDKPIRLIGSDSPVLDGDGIGTPLLIAAPDTEVQGLIVRNGGTDTSHYDSGIMIQAPRATVTNCRVEGGGFGIYLRGVDHCRIEYNIVVGNAEIIASKRGNGIHLWKTKYNVLTGNSIVGARDGIYLSYADQNLISNNRVERTRFGLHYMYSHQNRLEGNRFSKNSVGAALMFSRACVIEDNQAVANQRHGFLLKQVEHSRFTRNVMRDQNRGLFAQQAVQNQFSENIIADNDIGLYLSNGSEENVFVENAFVNNSDQIWQPPDEIEKGRCASNRFYEKNRGNFWSDYTGIDPKGDGIGSTPYHETDVFGYIMDRYPEVRLLATSPAAMLLRKGEEFMPLLDTKGVTDPFPLIRPPMFIDREKESWR